MHYIHTAELFYRASELYIKIQNHILPKIIQHTNSPCPQYQGQHKNKTVKLMWIFHLL